MHVTVGQVLALLNEIAPLELAEEWDNVGLLAGHPDSRVEVALCALDLTMRVVEEAAARGAQLIVTHHPILFRGRKSLCETDAEGRALCALVRRGIALIAMHTNWDNACPGVGDALAEALGLAGVQALDNGLRLGAVEAQALSDFAARAGNALGGAIRVYGEAGRAIRRVAVMGGAGEDFARQALEAGADAYLTGEVAYHKALDAVDNGLCVLEAGHAATERPGILALSRGLQIAADKVQYDIRVLNSEAGLYL